MHVQRSWAGDIDYLKVYYRTSTSGTWTQLVEYTGAVASWTTEEDIMLPNTSATYQLAFEHTDNYGYGVGLDQIVISAPSACPKPTLGAAEHITLEGASFQWTENGSATQWQLQYSTSADFTNPTNIDRNGIPSYAITGLNAGTVYYVHVRSYCGDGEWSEWSNMVSFNTLLCAEENMCEITFDLTDSYGDGWNGNAIQVVDALTGVALGSVTIESGSSNTATVSVCDGRAINFVWVTGSYAYETSYTAYDINGEMIFSGSGGSGLITNYTVSCTTSSCRKPTDLATTVVGKRNATISWTENGEATAWQVEVTDLDGGQVTTWNANATTFEIVGLTPDTRYSVRVNPVCEDEKWSDAITFRTEVACPAPTALEVVPTPISATVTWTGDASNYTLRYGTCAEPDPTQPATIIFHADDIWQDGSGYQMLLDADATAYGTIIPETGALSMECSGNEDIYAEFEYKIPANADGECTTSNVVIDNTITLQIPAGTYDWCITNPTPGDRIWIASAQGNVGGRKDDYVFEAGMIYEFNMYMLGSNDATDVTIMCSNVDWTYVNNATSPYTINGLDPETEYFVGVQAVCGGEDGESAWTNATFTTPSNCEAPTALNVTNLMPTTATLNWTGYQDGFEVWYRPVAEGAELINEDFENGLTWTTIDADGDGFNWDLHVNTGTGNHATHSGDGVMTSASYDNDASAALTPDNYLVSPQVELGGSITFWACAQDGSWPEEHFGVAVSTTSNTDASAFTTIQEWTMTAKKGVADCKSMYNSSNYLKKNRGNRAEGTWYPYTVDLSAYAGQTGYVAIRHFNCTDMFYLNVDDIIINGPATEEQEWTMVTTDATSYNAEGLEPETAYEWQVRGENRSCSEDGYTEWSEMGNFTTPGLCDKPINLAAAVLATTATLSWTGYQESYNVTYYTPATGNVLLETGVGFDGDEDWTEVTEDEETGFYYLSDDYSYLGYGFSSTSTPQYLISPEFDALEGESFVEFMYYATGTEENENFPETFKIGYSTTDAEVASFTWGELYTVSGIDYMDVDLPAGAKYFAIQYESDHAADSTLLFFLDFTVVSNYVAAGEPTTLAGVTSPVTISGLTPETIYRWEVTGICGEESTTEMVYNYFMTLSAQTIELTEGWNWFSTYIDMNEVDGLTMLEQALGDNAEMIKSKIFADEFDGEEWYRDDDMTLNNEEMFMIYVINACTVTLEGPAADPAAHPITINQGWNWIGFPCTEETDINVALSGFQAEEGDAIKSYSVIAETDGEEWYPDGEEMETLKPGTGYMYFYNGGTPQTLVYQTGAKAVRATGSELLPAKKQASVKQSLKIQK